MNKRHNFTLVELLVVIGIIAILAGLILGAVSISQTSARNTQAKSDMASIIMALRAVETTYGKIVNTANKFNGEEADKKKSVNDKDTWILGNSESEDAYDNFIAELSVPKDEKFIKNNNNNKEFLGNINKRKLVFLEPKSSFDPSKAYNADDTQIAALWRDPWGKRYVIFINVNGEKYIKISNKKNVASDIAIYSCGPNGEDNEGCNADLDTCISSGTHKNHDDVASWSK